MDEAYIVNHIYPLIKKSQQRESRDFWVKLSVDWYNSHLYELAAERIKYIDEHPDEYPYPWMKK